jgi:hypothetical protein
MKLYVPRLIVAPPQDWVPCDGRTLDRRVYHELFAMIGTAYGGGDGVSTFSVPDHRTQFGLPEHCHAFSPQMATTQRRFILPGQIQYFAGEMRNLSVTG